MNVLDAAKYHANQDDYKYRADQATALALISIAESLEKIELHLRPEIINRAVEKKD